MAGARAKRVPRWVWLLAKAAVVAALVAWMYSKGLIRLDDLARAAGRWPLLAAGWALILLGVFCAAIRWGILLRAHGIHIPLADLFALTMTGLFFMVLTPGGVGGDAVKAWYVARDREQKAAAATTVFLDRLLGMATLLLVAMVTVALDFHRLWNLEIHGLSPLGFPFGHTLVLSVAGCLAAILAFALLVTSKAVRRSRLPGRLARFIPLRRTAAAVYEALHAYGDRPGAVLGAAAMSLVSQVPLYAAYYLYAAAAGVELSVRSCALIVPLGVVIRAFPLVPGGAGQGVVAMSLLFPLAGAAAEKGATTGAIGDATFIMTCLLGGLFFLFSKAHRRGARAAEPADERGGAGPE